MIKEQNISEKIVARLKSRQPLNKNDKANTVLGYNSATNKTTIRSGNGDNFKTQNLSSLNPQNNTNSVLASRYRGY